MIGFIAFAEFLFFSGLWLGGYENPLHVRRKKQKRIRGKFQ